MSRVLFVSHNGDLRAVATRVLRKAGFDVTAAPHGGHALLECLGGRFDTVVIEDRLPEGPGGAVAERLRRYCPDIQVVRMWDRRTATAGDGPVLQRPFTADDLVAAIERATVSSASRTPSRPQAR
jgi:CheY-like chemotaxis protein